MNDKLISFVVPVKDEEHTITELFDRVASEVKQLGRELQVIFIDDGSTDTSWSIISALIEQHPQEVHGIRFRRNLGKAAALAAGFKAARGSIVFTMDADLQDDPKEISRFLAKLDEGYDLISGWKRTRHDPWHKVLPSRVFNKMLSRASGVRLHDHNCGFKCYRAAVVRELNVYGEMHRMMPSLAGMRGFKCTEIEVEHHPRRFGQSKYGVKRFLRGFMDMLTIWFLRQYRERPLHLMGGLAGTSLAVGVTSFVGSFAVDGLAGAKLAMLGTCLATAAAPLMTTGFLAELLISRRSRADRRLPVLEEVPTAELPVADADSIIALPVPVPAFSNRTLLPTEDDPLVLICDSDASARKLMSDHLRNAGFRVAHAKNGPEAILRMEHRPTVVLLDLMLLGTDSLAFLESIQDVAPDTKVILVSQHRAILQSVGATNPGVYDCIAKPLDANQVVAAVRRAAQQENLVRIQFSAAA